MVGAVHRDPADEVHRVVKRPEVAVLPAVDLVVVGVTARRCVGDRAHVPDRRGLRRVEAVRRATPGRDHRDESHLEVFVERHHLPVDVDFGAVGFGIGVERFRILERRDERRLIGTDSPGHRHFHQTLHGVDGIRRRFRVHAVAPPWIELHVSHALLVSLDDVARVAGAESLGRHGREHGAGRLLERSGRRWVECGGRGEPARSSCGAAVLVVTGAARLSSPARPPRRRSGSSR